FSVTATGDKPFRYQWKKNGVDITGATRSTYTTPPAAETDNGALFSVVVTNKLGSATSRSAVLTVSTSMVPPSIITGPTNQRVRSGTTATFSVTAQGTPPLSYQWRKNGVEIVGATGSSYTTPPTTTTDNGSLFSVVVSNSYGSVTSNDATLLVR
ncbi:MAG: immunoglobulin domain-containing protein, partial [Verrucomicrobiota bacterium]|nr:immunoglobulin domain-containing protein [Verrucomicrobiota bacterium]